MDGRTGHHGDDPRPGARSFGGRNKHSQETTGALEASLEAAPPPSASSPAPLLLRRPIRKLRSFPGCFGSLPFVSFQKVLGIFPGTAYQRWGCELQ